MNKIKCLNNLQLKIIATIAMLVDHIGLCFYPDQEIFTIVGRLAFPIFAFLIVEGILHTEDKKKYIIRMAIFAVLAEIPYDWMSYGVLFNWEHQNVLWTFVIAMVMLYWMIATEKEDHKSHLAALVGGVLFGGLIGKYLGCCFGPYGVILVLVFYLFRNSKYRYWLETVAVLILCAFALNSGTFCIGTMEIHTQIFGVLAMPLILLYNGERGKQNAFTKYFLYAFYPVHMLVLALLSRGI